MSDLSIRKMMPEHLEGIMAIERTSFSPPWSENAIISEMLSGNTVALVALKGARLVGYVTALTAGEDAHIHKVAVHPRFRRRGIARALTKRCLDKLRQRGCKNVYLEVRPSNEPAIKLYETFGFKIDGRRKAYYVAPEEDAILMSLRKQRNP